MIEYAGFLCSYFLAMETLSIVIPCYNAEDTLGDLLDALSNQTLHPWEVILADNGSTDTTRAIASRYDDKLPSFKVVDASVRRGSAYARNVGANASSGKFIAFCDADDVPSLNWVEELSKVLSEGSLIGSSLSHSRFNGPKSISAQQSGSQQCNPPFLPYVGGGSIAVCRNIHEQIGGFDEELLRLQDIDYCWRVQLNGITLKFADRAVIHARLRSTGWQTFRQAFAWGTYMPLLCKRYGKHGMTYLPWQAVLQDYFGLLKWSFTCLLFDRGNNSCCWLLGWRLGYLRGCVKYRVLAFVDP